MSTAKNVLIFPAGTEIAFEIQNALKYSKFVNLYGGTSAADHAQLVYKNLIEGFPYVTEAGFIAYLNDVIEQYHIEYIYPAHDSVCLFMSEHKAQINATVIISEHQTVAICRSKKETYAHFAGEAFVPKTFAAAAAVDCYPVFVKPTVGEGSKGAQKINNRNELDAALAKDDSLVICEYLSGEEYTVDCFTNQKGELLSAKMRDRARIRMGISVRSAQLAVDDAVQDIATRLNEKLHFSGAWFFQVKKSGTGAYKLLEASPRIPGTMGVSRNCGINYPLLTLFLFWGYDVSVIDNGYDILVDRAFYNTYQIDIAYTRAYLDYDDTLIVGGAVNKALLSFLYQAKEQGKELYIISKHAGDIYQDLARYHICASLFDKIIVIDQTDSKTNYIEPAGAIFIDDSFAERKRVRDALKIPVFDVDMVESLIDWRS